VTDDLYPEIARRLEPTVDDGDLPGTVNNAAVFQIIPIWCEIPRATPSDGSASSDEARAAAAARIEVYAASEADAIWQTAAHGPLRTSAARDASWQQPPRPTDRTRTERRVPRVAAPFSLAESLHQHD
jgi:hypothetical protein